MALTILPYLSPRLIIVDAPATSISVQDLTDEIKEWEDDPLNLSYAKVVTTSGKEDLGGGVLVGITAELQNAQLAFAQRPVSVFNGTSTVADSDGTTLTDTSSGGINFVTLGVKVGDTIMNTSDGSVATILTVSASAITHFALEDGTDNDWDFGDQYKIWNKVQCEVNGGNLVAVDGNGSSITAFHPTAFTHVIRTSASSATLQELSAIQYSSFGGGVTIDVVNGTAGTTFPIGTIESPVNNVSDAILIDTERGFSKLFISGDITFTTGDNITNLEVYGQSPNRTNVTVDAAAIVEGAEFHCCSIAGTLDADASICNAIIQNLAYFEGYIKDSIIIGTLTLGGTDTTYLINCSDGNPGSINMIVDMGGSGRDLMVTDHSGGITLKNLTGSNIAVLNVDVGRIEIDSTVTAGEIWCRGVGTITDNSTDTAVVYDNTLTQDCIASAVWNEDLNNHPLQSGENTAGDALTNAGAVASPSVIADAVWDELSSEHLNTNSMGDIINRILLTSEIRQCSVNDSSASSTKFITDLTEISNSFWTRGSLLFTSGQNKGQIRSIKSYGGGTKEVQLQTPLAQAPANNDLFVIVNGRKFLTPDILELADAVWDEPISGHIAVGTFGKAIGNILQVEQGNWKIINNQLVMYESDGTTELFKFNLLDTAGQPTSTNVVTRVKV